ncbi:MAG: CPXCG motif-containing cysteine-rich protein [Flavobacteriaceae bacterium]|nr:CPXCG motif-containing cysteine-rich protein [Flavobacteriaceae bacterium]
MIEHFFQCPYCWQNISMLLDESTSEQEYIEDCEVCCRPIRLSFTFDVGELTRFEAFHLDDY